MARKAPKYLTHDDIEISILFKRSGGRCSQTELCILEIKENKCVRAHTLLSILTSVNYTNSNTNLLKVILINKSNEWYVLTLFKNKTILY